jgi:hypothetical protein
MNYPFISKILILIIIILCLLYIINIKLNYEMHQDDKIIETTLREKNILLIDV